jgi:hypothetical protein
MKCEFCPHPAHAGKCGMLTATEQQMVANGVQMTGCDCIATPNAWRDGDAQNVKKIR